MGEAQWYVTPYMHTPSGDIGRGHGGEQWLMPDFDPDRGGLQRRVGPLQYDERMLQQGCTPTGASRGPAGYEQMQYNCPNRPWGIPTGVGALSSTAFSAVAAVGLVAVVGLIGIIAYKTFVKDHDEAL
jgi:hypothetical protein